jgi:hypothetical protein
VTFLRLGVVFIIVGLNWPSVVLGIGKIPYVTAVPIQKSRLSQYISKKAVYSGDNLYTVQLDRSLVEDKNVNEEVDLVQIGFDHRDLIKGRVIKRFFSKTIQTVVIKPLQLLTGTGVVQANLNLESDQNVFKVPLNSLRNARGLVGSIYVVDPLTDIVVKKDVRILGFDGPNILIQGESVSDSYWVVVSGFHKVVSGRKVRISSNPF